MTEVTITRLPPAPLHALEVWSNPAKIAARIRKATGLALPPMGGSVHNASLHLIRYEPTVWLVEGEVSALPVLLDEDGALTAIGGGIVRVELSGPRWRRLLMEGGVFDAESPAFAPGCSAATVIDHLAVRLLVTGDNTCLVYVPLSFAAGLIAFWESAALALA